MGKSGGDNEDRQKWVHNFSSNSNREESVDENDEGVIDRSKTKNYSSARKPKYTKVSARSTQTKNLPECPCPQGRDTIPPLCLAALIEGKSPRGFRQPSVYGKGKMTRNVGYPRDTGASSGDFNQLCCSPCCPWGHCNGWNCTGCCGEVWNRFACWATKIDPVAENTCPTEKNMKLIMAFAYGPLGGFDLNREKDNIDWVPGCTAVGNGGCHTGAGCCTGGLPCGKDRCGGNPKAYNCNEVLGPCGNGKSSYGCGPPPPDKGGNTGGGKGQNCQVCSSPFGPCIEYSLFVPDYLTNGGEKKKDKGKKDKKEKKDKKGKKSKKMSLSFIDSIVTSGTTSDGSNENDLDYNSEDSNSNATLNATTENETSDETTSDDDTQAIKSTGFVAKSSVVKTNEQVTAISINDLKKSNYHNPDESKNIKEINFVSKKKAKPSNLVYTTYPTNVLTPPFKDFKYGTYFYHERKDQKVQTGKSEGFKQENQSQSQNAQQPHGKNHHKKSLQHSNQKQHSNHQQPTIQQIQQQMNIPTFSNQKYSQNPNPVPSNSKKKHNIVLVNNRDTPVTLSLATGEKLSLNRDMKFANNEGIEEKKKEIESEIENESSEEQISDDLVEEFNESRNQIQNSNQDREIVSEVEPSKIPIINEDFETSIQSMSQEGIEIKSHKKGDKVIFDVPLKLFNMAKKDGKIIQGKSRKPGETKQERSLASKAKTFTFKIANRDGKNYISPITERTGLPANFDVTTLYEPRDDNYEESIPATLTVPLSSYGPAHNHPHHKNPRYQEPGRSRINETSGISGAPSHPSHLNRLRTKHKKRQNQNYYNLYQ